MVRFDARLARHLDAEHVAAYLDRQLVDEEQDGVEVHLAQCSRCRAEVLETARILTRARRRSRLYVWTPIAAAAAAILLLWLPIGQTENPLNDALAPVERSAPGETVPHITALGPAEAATVDPTALAFRWQPAGPDVLYRVILADAQGSELWTGNTADSVLPLPSTVTLEPGTYFWYVDALLPDGHSATSGMHRFEIHP